MAKIMKVANGSVPLAGYGVFEKRNPASEGRFRPVPFPPDPISEPPAPFTTPCGVPELFKIRLHPRKHCGYVSLESAFLRQGLEQDLPIRRRGR